MAATYYKPTCAADCSTNTLPVFGSVCIGEAAVEMGEIQDLFLDDESATAGIPKNPITGWVSTNLATDDTDNETVILTWKAAVSNTTSAKVRHLEGTGDKPEPTGTDIELPKNKIITINKKQVINISTNVMNAARYEAFRALQCGGEKYIWYATDKGFYGGLNGIKANIDKAYFVLGGKGQPKTFNMVLSWTESIDPPRDAKPFS